MSFISYRQFKPGVHHVASERGHALTVSEMVFSVESFDSHLSRVEVRLSGGRAAGSSATTMIVVHDVHGFENDFDHGDHADLVRIPGDCGIPVDLERIHVDFARTRVDHGTLVAHGIHVGLERIHVGLVRIHGAHERILVDPVASACVIATCFFREHAELFEKTVRALGTRSDGDD